MDGVVRRVHAASSLLFGIALTLSFWSRLASLLSSSLVFFRIPFSPCVISPAFTTLIMIPRTLAWTGARCGCVAFRRALHYHRILYIVGKRFSSDTPWPMAPHVAPYMPTCRCDLEHTPSLAPPLAPPLPSDPRQLLFFPFRFVLLS